MKLYSISLATGRNKSVKVEPIAARSSRHAITVAKRIAGTSAEFVQCERMSPRETAFWRNEEPEAIHRDIEHSTAAAESNRRTY
jgi:hypothetical protein